MTARSFLVLFALGFFVICEIARPVVPARDAASPDSTRRTDRTPCLTLGGNTAAGWFSLWSDTDGGYNTAVRAGTLLFNVGNQSTGEGAQNRHWHDNASDNTTGSFDTATGTSAVVNTTEGVANTAVDGSALFTNVTGINNTAVGYHTLFSSNGDPSFGKSSYNCAFRAFALADNSTGRYNSVLDPFCTPVQYHCEDNAATGYVALNSNTIGNFNTATVQGSLQQHDAVPKHRQRSGCAS